MIVVKINIKVCFAFHKIIFHPEKDDKLDDSLLEADWLQNIFVRSSIQFEASEKSQYPNGSWPVWPEKIDKCL